MPSIECVTNDECLCASCSPGDCAPVSDDDWWRLTYVLKSSDADALTGFSDYLTWTKIESANLAFWLLKKVLETEIEWIEDPEN